MKLLYTLFASLTLTFSSFAQSIDKIIEKIPNPRKNNGSWIYQDVDVIKSRQGDINNLIDSMESSTRAEIAVVVLGSIGNNSIEDFGTTLFQRWGIGKSEEDNGVLILHVLDQKKIRIEVGHGLEPILTDLYCKRIISDVMAPYFKENNFPDGHYWGVKGIESLIRGNRITDFSTFAKSPLKGNNVKVEELVLAKTEAFSQEELRKEKEFYFFISFVAIGILLLIAVIFTIIFIVGKSRRDPLQKYRFVQKEATYLSWMVSPVLASIGVYFLFSQGTGYMSIISFGVAFISKVFPWRILGSKESLQKLRSTARTCSKCSQSMKKLSENQEDKYLDELKIAEEKVDITDYDVWVCNCGNVRIDDYESGRQARKCPSCKKPTYVIVGSQTLSEATRTTSGKKKHFYECGYCSHKDQVLVTIPAYGSTSSSSSSRSGGGSSSSFGGGSSGGGGATGSY